MNAQAASQVLFETGVVVGGKYRIVSLIGIGGVGRVYLARHIELDTEVAIKVLRPEMADRPDAVQRFGREARASVRLRSERIARVLDVGTHEGKPYFVMEHMAGCNLLEYRQQSNVDIATLCEFFIQACEGLADAHAQGVVHRDIKSENLFVVRDSSGWRSLKVFDFGISKFSLTGKFSDVDLAAMRTEAMMGTPHYISPEQIRATRDVDHRTDLWSLGAVMFEVLSGGVLPFREEREVTALIAEVLEQPHRSLLDVAPNVPERLAAIIDRCLEKDREFRYQTAAEIALDLLPLAPARARASAERAVSVMQTAGLMAVNGDMESLRPMPTTPAERLSSPPRFSTPAPASDDALPAPNSGLRPSESPPAAAAVPLRPSGSAVGGSAPPPPKPARVHSSTRTTDPEHASPLLGGAPPQPSPTPQARATPLPVMDVVDDDQAKRRKRKLWLLVLLVASCALAGVILASTAGDSPGRPPLTPASVAASPLPPQPAAPSAPLPAPAPGLSVSALPARSAPVKAAPPRVVWSPRPAAAKPAPSPVKSSDFPPPSPPIKLELRRER